MEHSLVHKLAEGPLDIVGDIHGEIDALLSLLWHLGYNEHGVHPDGRRMVFLGDLTDRGPDSPAVVDLVERLVSSGQAQCILGNHEFNILLEAPKHDNHWFFGEQWALDCADQPTPAKLADVEIKNKVSNFFRTLPLVLERDDFRVVHACWEDNMVEIARSWNDAVALHNVYESEIQRRLSDSNLDNTDRGLALQNQNPVKVLTSGKERRIATPFFASGKMRYEERVPWWEDYDDEVHCIFGHYSIYRDQARFDSRAICVDFAVAKRWQERKQPDFDGHFRGCLGAIRVPEWEVVFDDGKRTKLSE